MRYITGHSLNNLLYLLFSSMELGFSGTDYRVDFWDFIGSQTKAKILDYDYSDLLCATVAVNKLYSNGLKTSEDMLEDIKPLYMCFIHHMSVVGIKLYLTKGVKLHFTLPRKLYESGVECELIDAESSCVNIITYYPVCEDLNFYLGLMRSEVTQFNYKSMDLNNLDYDYLSKMKMYYDSYKSELIVIERRDEVEGI